MSPSPSVFVSEMFCYLLIHPQSAEFRKINLYRVAVAVEESSRVDEMRGIMI